MTHHGQSNGGGPLLQPATHTIPNQRSGKFTATLGPSHAGRALNAIPEGALLALLSRAPKPEGDQFVELDHPEYRRQAINFEAGGASTLANTKAIRFELGQNAERATHVALILDERAIWYGPMMEQSNVCAPSSPAVYFERFALSIKRR